MEDYGAELVAFEPTKAGGADAPLDRIATTNITSMFWAFKRVLAQGRFQRNFFFADPVIVRADSQVAVSITELNDDGIPIIGQANMSIFNVVPQGDGTITVRGLVDWPDRLFCQLNFIIVN